MNKKRDSKDINTIIFGATGMVGSEVLRQALDNEEIKKITTIGRKKVRFLSKRVAKDLR